MRSIALTVILTFTVLFSLSQNIRKAEKRALKCIEKKLKDADMELKYLIAIIDDFNRVANEEEFYQLQVKQREIDAAFAKSGIYKSARLDISLLYNCLAGAYDVNNAKSDTASSYHKLVTHMAYEINNPDITKNTSPWLRLKVLRTLINNGDYKFEFYRLISFILFQGILKDYDYIKKEQKAKNIIPQDYRELEDDRDLKQNKDVPNNDNVFGTVVEEMPRFPNGNEALKQYLRVSSDSIKGRVVVECIINSSGQVINPKVIVGLTAEYDAAAIELFNAMPRWTPGRQNGKTVDVKIIHPVIFE